uniref:Uncharacterized protein n=1 Tax=Steinernema glaseri TaxID=37863 RepID=A0A1I7XWU9_9BILA
MEPERERNSKARRRAEIVPLFGAPRGPGIKKTCNGAAAAAENGVLTKNCNRWLPLHPPSGHRATLNVGHRRHLQIQRPIRSTVI